MTEHEMEQINNQFQQMNRRFDHIDQRLDKVDERFDQIDQRFDQVDQRFKQVDERFEQVDQRFKQVDERFERVEKGVHELGVQFEDQRDKLTQVAEAIQIAQGVTNAKLDELNESLNRRLDPLELVVRDHSKRLDKLEERK